ncbi:cation diffusion facilitator family transporter [Oscillatoria sp. CS-180]|uniref:cation diffusion facilitator family transporter n=1 Tax=Oscillatoria sp. CS-180 TaxID=3021720 RepID=UPI00232CD567|nr:cation diffusion facilitator family transporter [Oscillatoria sp. CS-180]MDB9526077.1 cation diffusion facilitator family transporter [Oscillatoria sp. CS-180]
MISAVDRDRRNCYRLLLTWLWVTLLVLGIEAIAGWITQSLLLLAEALHTFVDAFSTGLSLIAVASPQRPLGREVWGHGRAEVASTLGIVSFLGFTGLSLLLAALQQAINAFSRQPDPFKAMIDRSVVYLIVAAIVLSLMVAVYAYSRSRNLGSLALVLHSQHVLGDAWLSGVTLAGIIAIWQQQTWVDPCLAFLLTLFVIRSLWKVLYDQLPALVRPMAIAPEAVAHIVTQVEGVTRCVRIRSRGLVGRQVWVELHVVIHPDFLGVAHIVGERIDAALRLQYGPLRTQIWVEETYPTAKLPKKDDSNHAWSESENPSDSWTEGF